MTREHALTKPLKTTKRSCALALVAILAITASAPFAYAADYYAGWQESNYQYGVQSIMKPTEEASQTNSLINSHVSSDEETANWIQAGWYDSSLYAGGDCNQTSGAMIRYIEIHIDVKYCYQLGSVSSGTEYTYQVYRGSSCGTDKYYWYAYIGASGYYACLNFGSSRHFAQLESKDLSNTAESKFRELKHYGTGFSWSYWDGSYSVHCNATSYFTTNKTSNTEFNAKDGSGSCQ